MWTQISVNDAVGLQNFVAVMRQMDDRYGTLQVGDILQILRVSSAEACRLSSVSQRFTNLYNGDGQRVERAGSLGVPAGVERYIWDGQNVLMETDNTGATKVVYTLEPKQYGNLISQRR